MKKTPMSFVKIYKRSRAALWILARARDKTGQCMLAAELRDTILRSARHLMLEPIHILSLRRYAMPSSLDGRYR